MRGIQVPERPKRIEPTLEQAAAMALRRPHVVALDVGRTKDWAVVSVLAVHTDPGPEPHRPRLVLKSLTRAPRSTPHRKLAAGMAGAVNHYRDLGHPTLAAIDATGIGDGTAELAAELVPVLFQVVITGGDKAKLDDVVPWRWSVPKRDLVDVIVRIMQDGRLDASPLAGQLDPNGNPIGPAFAQELEAFRELTTVRRDGSTKTTIGNDPSIAEHDDLVLSVAIGLWTLDRAVRDGLLHNG